MILVIGGAGDIPSYRYDFSKIKKLGWEARQILKRLLGLN